MPRKVIYNCVICHETIENIDTIRLAKQEYGVSKYGGHYTVEHYDFCEKCFQKFMNWLRKHEKSD